MRANTLLLELAMESHPNHVLIVGAVDAVPAVGDYVNREDSGWFGYVKRRKWTVRADGKGIEVRCWLHKDSP